MEDTRSSARRRRRWMRLAPAAALAATLALGGTVIRAQDPYDPTKIPNLSGTWDGSTRARPVNSENFPWTKANFPVLNERALAYQKVFDEALSPKYDCQPSSSPAIQYDPYTMQVMQWPDRVVFRYEKDDQTAHGLARRPEADRATTGHPGLLRRAATRATRSWSRPTTSSSTSPASTTTTASRRRSRNGCRTLLARGRRNCG